MYLFQVRAEYVHGKRLMRLGRNQSVPGSAPARDFSLSRARPPPLVGRAVVLATRIRSGVFNPEPLPRSRPAFRGPRLRTGPHPIAPGPGDEVDPARLRPASAWPDAAS